jgi:HlyD family secretion protein
MHSKPNPRRIVPILLILVALAAFAYWYFAVRPAQADTGELSASGTLEITQIQISPELGGKIVAVNVSEGDLVKSGQVLAQLDTTLLQTQRAQAASSLEAAQASNEGASINVKAAESAAEAARFGVDAAQASLDLIQSGASAEQLAAAQAQVSQAQASYQAALASFAALTAGARPEDVATARQRLDLARQEYYSMTVTLSNDQINAITTTLSTAQTNLEQAQTRLAELKSDSAMPAVALETAANAVNDATAAVEASHATLAAIQDSALPFYRQIEAARLNWNIAQLNLSQASARRRLLLGTRDIPQSALDAANDTEDDAQNLVDDAKAAYDALDASPQGNQLSAAWNEVNTALTSLSSLARSAAAPVETALNQIEAASALVEMTTANLSSLQNGARSEQIRLAQAQLAMAQAQFDAANTRTEAARAQAAAAQAQVNITQAALDALDVQIGKLTITAPTDGVVLTRIIQPGEFVAPGAVLLVLGRTDEKTITVYIPEDSYGLLSLGQSALLSVDSFPGVTFDATVIHIADQAEFTPRNVQTVEGRKNTVFAIKLRVSDPDDRLKAGMPADVVFK